MNALHVVAMQEIRHGIRNRWAVGSIVLLTALAVSLLLLGSTPVGTVKADPLAVTVVSLSSLSVYLIPLIALTLSFDAVIGELERGTMLLLLTHPVSRWQVIGGKFIGHVAILAAAVLIGFGATGAAIGFQGQADFSGVLAYLKMMGSSLMLGAVFIALGYLVSLLARERATAVAYAIGLWLGFVVLYDLALLGVLVADSGGRLDQGLFSALLLASPTDLYRVFNLTGVEAVQAVTGMTAVADGLELGRGAMVIILSAWIAAPLAAAGLLFKRKEL